MRGKMSNFIWVHSLKQSSLRLTARIINKLCGNLTSAHYQCHFIISFMQYFSNVLNSGKLNQEGKFLGKCYYSHSYLTNLIAQKFLARKKQWPVTVVSSIWIGFKPRYLLRCHLSFFGFWLPWTKIEHQKSSFQVSSGMLSTSKSRFGWKKNATESRFLIFNLGKQKFMN